MSTQDEASSATRPRTHFATGRTLALCGIVLVALSLRSAISAVSPISHQISAVIPLQGIRLGIIGMLPPACFAVFGVLTPVASRRIGLEWATVMAIIAMVAGHVTRAAAGGFDVFLLGSILAFAGTGMGNALLPPLVKRYFPDRIGTVTSLYVAALSISAFVPPLIAVPIAESEPGWRASLALWGICAAVALIPWVAIAIPHRRNQNGITPHPLRAMTSSPAAGAKGASGPPYEAAVLLQQHDLTARNFDQDDRSQFALWKSPTAWAIAAVFASSSMTMYAIFAWLPALLIDSSRVNALTAGGLLAVYAAAGFPASLVIPGIIVRYHNSPLLIGLGITSVTAGILGLLLAPTSAPWAWAILLSLGRMLYPIAMTLINARTTSHRGSAQLSGFVSGVGYTLGLFGPLLFGVLHDVSGGWTLPLLYLLVPAAIALLAIIPLSRLRMVSGEPIPKSP